MIKIEHNIELDKIITTEMSGDDLVQWELDKAKAQAEVELVAKAANAKAALLEKLGLTEEEAKLLLS